MVGLDGPRHMFLSHKVGSEEHERIWRTRDVTL